MIPENFLEILLRLSLAVILGGLIGIERQGGNHNAGLRTHILVCLGAAGIMIMSEAMALQFGSDVGRIGAQVVSGIGFLGAGCILVNGSKIKGLTTAAGLWATACVGLCIGLGYYFLSLAMAILMFIVMLVLRPLGNKLHKKGTTRDFAVQVTLSKREDFSFVTDLLHEEDFNISSISACGEAAFVIKISGEVESNITELICRLMQEETVISASRID